MKITIGVTIEAPVNKVWSCWITPENIKQWNFASDDWICPQASNNLAVGQKFNYRMEARDGSMGFDFEGRYTAIKENELIEYEMDDNRKVQVVFTEKDGATELKETFETEEVHSAEMQKQGWQSILNNFKKHVEQLNNSKR